MGVVILGAAVLYLVVSLVVVVVTARAARKKGRSLWRWGGGAALVMYLLVFWDHIPTVVAHKYYCEKEAGFWVYKTLDQWKQENPGVMETLMAYSDGRSAKGAYILNQRFNRTVTRSDRLFFNRWRWEQQIVDSKTNQVLAGYVDFSTGNGNIGGELPLRFWLQRDHCSGGKNDKGRMYLFADSVRGKTK